MKQIAGIFLLSIILLSGCKNTTSSSQSSKTATKDDPVMLTVNNVDVRVSEFDYIYSKNNSRADSAYSKTSIEDYLDLYVKFKLKVTEAETQKLDTATSFVKELAGYKKQLAKPYMTEQGFIEKLTKEVYDRLTEEVATSHILIKVGREADPSDSLKAYTKIASIRDSIVKKGADFGDLAVAFSEDPSAQMSNAPVGYRGNLGYFTALSLVYEYENAMYDTPVGQVSNIFRTQYGYHILRIEDRRKTKGEVVVGHIMVRAADGISEEDSLGARKKIDEIYAKATENNADWANLCKLFSDDQRSKNSEGKIRPFRMGGQLGMPAFEEAAFALQNPGDVSKPVKSPYGWHVIRLYEKKGLAPFEEMKDDLEKKISKKPRAQMDKPLLVQRLKKENGFKVNEQGKNAAWSYADSTLIEGKWSFDAQSSDLEKELFTVGNRSFTIGDFFAYLKKNQRPRPAISPAYAMQLNFYNFADKQVIEYEEDHLEEKYYDYKMLVKEYRDGILLFQLMDENVWSKAVKDTAGLRKFYQANQANYMWGERLKGSVYSVGDQATLDDLKKAVEAGKSNTELEEQFNSESALTLKVEEGTWEKGRNDIVDAVDWSSNTSTLEKEGRFYLVKAEETLPPTQKALKEARGLIISDYQDELEAAWIAELREKYPVEINQDVVQSLIKE